MIVIWCLNLYWIGVGEKSGSCWLGLLVKHPKPQTSLMTHENPLEFGGAPCEAESPVCKYISYERPGLSLNRSNLV